MRLAVSGLMLLALALPAQAQVGPIGPVHLKLDLSVDDTMLIVETLGQISCPNVAALATCNRAVDLLAEIKKQVKAQGQ